MASTHHHGTTSLDHSASGTSWYATRGLARARVSARRVALSHAHLWQQALLVDKRAAEACQTGHGIRRVVTGTCARNCFASRTQASMILAWCDLEYGAAAVSEHGDHGQSAKPRGSSTAAVVSAGLAGSMAMQSSGVPGTTTAAASASASAAVATGQRSGSVRDGAGASSCAVTGSHTGFHSLGRLKCTPLRVHDSSWTPAHLRYVSRCLLGFNVRAVGAQARRLPAACINSRGLECVAEQPCSHVSFCVHCGSPHSLGSY